MATIEESITALDSPVSIETVEPRQARPILWWAVLGAGFCLLAAYIWGAWIISGDAKATPTGPTDVPTYMVVWARFNEIITAGGTAILLWFVVVRGWRRAGQLTFDGAFALASVGIYWQDPIYNWSQASFSYNSVLINWGSWSSWIPGWMSQKGTLMPEGIFFVGAWYGAGLWLGVIGANAVMRRAQARWPRMGKLGLVGVCLALMFVVDVFLELAYIRWGLYSYAGAIPWMTLFHGRYYQFPLYEMVLWGSCWAAMACFRYFRDDKGRSVVERGIDQVRVGKRGKNALRFLSVYAMMNILFLGVYNIPMQFFSLHSAPWPEDVLKRSYFTNGVCGGDSGYACSNPVLPVNRTGRGVHIAPDGSVVVPDHVQLPKPVDQ